MSTQPLGKKGGIRMRVMRRLVWLPLRGRRLRLSTVARVDRLLVAAIGEVMRAAPVAVAGLALLTLVAALPPVATAWLTKRLVDGLAGVATGPQVLTIAVALAGTGVAATVLPQLSAFVAGHLNRRVARTCLGQLYRAVNQAPGIARFEDPQFIDHLRLAQRSGGFATARVVTILMGLAGSACTTAGLLASMAVLSPGVTIMLSVSAIPVVIAQISLARQRSWLMWTISPVERREVALETLLSNVQAAQEVRLFNLGSWLQGKMLAARVAADAHRAAADRRTLLVQGGCGLISATAAGIGLVWAVNAAGHGQLSVGSISLFISATASLLSALTAAATGVGSLHEQLLYYRHHHTVVTSPPDLPIANRPQPIARLRRGIELRDVWFRYSPTGPWILRGVSATIPAGAATAVVGHNGAGKSTLIKLLCRFYDPTRGAILWDGVDLRDLDPAQLRERIGAVFQDFIHYELSAADNIAVGDLSALGDLPRIRAAARAADIDTALRELPDGYHTYLTRQYFFLNSHDEEQSGVVLSGGQWQRLAVARSLLATDTDVLILDEPSSGLDPQAEADIHHLLLEHRTGRTSLLISHRLNTVRDADTILVLDHGRITETGDHTTLMTRNGTYATLFHLQADGYQHQQQPLTPLQP
ncbi:ABC transporter ATP-binding protein [Nocardia nepalensis]|uniref:ABC transporter ATP-binding protein n=1 Tax=Nocardia nepalensis TaxID=3375448 RepID=UPI003B674B4F